MLDTLAESRLGWGLVFVADDTNLGNGPRLNCQNFNPRPVDPRLIQEMRRNAESEGLANRVADQAIQIGVRRNYISKGLDPERRPTIYTNHIEWTDLAKSPNSTIELIDGNHHVSYMQEKDAKQVFLLAEYKQDMPHENTPRLRSNLEKRMSKLEELLTTDGIWLAEIFDLGMFL
jgi:hypothetical protein